jgi:chromosome segregation ATPase
MAQAPITRMTLTKAAVGEKIRRVEEGVDEFRNYLERKGENAKSAAASPQAQEAKGKRRRTATESQKATATAKKDELDDALGDLNRSTNRLRRKFDPTDKWQETRVQVEAVLDDGRKINQAVARGNYGSEAARLWAALRNAINDLARAYGLAPIGV